MSFDTAGSFLFRVTEKYKLTKQANASMACRQVVKVFEEFFPEFKEHWKPIKLEEKVLHIQVLDASAGSALFLRTMEVMETLSKQNIKGIDNIQISRNVNKNL